MKRFIFITCSTLLVAACGCSGAYWYQPSKTLEQCIQDYSNCALTGWKEHFAPYSKGRKPICSIDAEQILLNFCKQCMQGQDYQEYTKEQLPTGIRIRHLGGSVYAVGD